MFMRKRMTLMKILHLLLILSSIARHPANLPFGPFTLDILRTYNYSTSDVVRITP